MKLSKKDLEIRLSKLQQISNPKNELEQYSTDSVLASEILNLAFINGNIKERTVMDAGSGNGIFSYGSIYFGARLVTALEIDKDQEGVLHKNLSGFKNVEILTDDIRNINGHWDTVFCNTPFGSVIRDSDLPFLEKIFKIGDFIYLIHNWKVKDFVLNFLKGRATVLSYSRKKLIIPRTYSHHEKDRVSIDVLFLYAKRLE
ncbi:MAG: METTL5 family protein [Thermoplasmatales archaeon]|nr:MAG: METTL5 family protein [Thermoplasmatales archaeon]